MNIRDKFVSGIVQLILKTMFKKPTIYGINNIDHSSPAIFMSNHMHIYGPVVSTLYFPVKARQWANSMMTEKKACRIYLKDVFFMPKLNYSERKATIGGNLFGGLVASALRGANTIVSYWDPARAPLSLKNGLNAIENGDHQVLFAQGRYHPQAENFQFMQGYLVMCKMAYKRLGFYPKIYPVAINQEKETLCIGKPTVINPDLSFKAEKMRVNEYLKKRVNLGYTEPKEMSAEVESFENDV